MGLILKFERSKENMQTAAKYPLISANNVQKRAVSGDPGLTCKMNMASDPMLWKHYSSLYLEASYKKCCLLKYYKCVCVWSYNDFQ